jgi:mannose-6-phosphate isomerase
MIYFMNADNFVPFSRTPWAGNAIAEVKKKHPCLKNIPQKIGETWEVSTEPSFPSWATTLNGECVPLPELLNKFGEYILGSEIFSKFGNHSPLLLKWLHASKNLSVQVHPDNFSTLLQPHECGKPEAWLVLNAEKNASIYLGFKENFTKNEIEHAFKNGEPEKVMFTYKPRNFDFILVPPGCVHAVGPGVLIAEPQYVLPQKTGVTWRLGDWGRKYNSVGEEDSTGKPRELHLEKGLSVVDWSLPQGKKLIDKLVLQRSRIEGNEENPFACEYFNEPKTYTYSQLVSDSFSILTVWAGEVAFMVSKSGEPPVCVNITQGQSILISAQVKTAQFILKPLQEKLVGCAFFAFNTKYQGGKKKHGGV